MPRHTELNLVEIESEITKEELLRIEQEQERLSERPNELPLKQIHVADQVFQWRLSGDNDLEDERHTLELVRVLVENDEPLDPILLTAIGQRLFVVDGHHRLQAYLTAKWDRPVPVRYFEGCVVEAYKEALLCNSKNKLPMTQADKLEAAWRLVKDTDAGMTQVAIGRATTVSRRTISTMVRMLREHGERVAHLDWRHAKNFERLEDEDFDVESWKDEAARRMSRQLLKNLGSHPHRHPDILAMAFRYISEDLAIGLRDALIEELGDPEDDGWDDLDI